MRRAERDSHLLLAGGRCAMQIPQSPARRTASSFGRGDLVLVRRARWRIVDVRAHDDCQVVTLRGLAPPHLGVERRVLTPVRDASSRSPGRRAADRPRSQWRRACRALLAADGPPGVAARRAIARGSISCRISSSRRLPSSAGSARGCCSPTKSASARRFRRASSRRSCSARGAIDRVLILTPAGLREQWPQELAGRFAIDAPSSTATRLRRLAADAAGRRQPVVDADSGHRVDRLRQAAGGAAGRRRVPLGPRHRRRSARRRRRLRPSRRGAGARVPRRLRPAADGDAAQRRSRVVRGALRLGDGRRRTPLLVFRRTRADVGIGTTRRVHTSACGRARTNAHARAAGALHATPFGHERRARRDAWLALSVLHKRAFSSAVVAGAVGRAAPGGAVRRRTTAGASSSRCRSAIRTASYRGGRAAGVAGGPAACRIRRANGAADGAARGRALQRRPRNEAGGARRLLRRAREPAIVFTEYRDTLLHLRQRLARPARSCCTAA